MSGFSDSFQPYGTPQNEEIPQRPPPLPAGLIAICVIAIVLGVLGILGAFAGAVGLVAGDSMQGLFEQPGEAGKAMREMQSEVSAVARKFFLQSLLDVLLHLFTAVLVVAGAIMTLRRSAKGPSIFGFGCAASILYLIGSGVLYVIVQLQILPIYKNLGQMPGPAGDGRQAGMDPSSMSSFMIGVLVVTIAGRICFSLAEIVYYLISILYLRKSKVRALFQPPETVVRSM